MSDQVRPTALGSEAFRRAYNVKYAYVAGSMYKGIASKELVVRMGKAGLLGFLGTGGLRSARIENDLRHIQAELRHGQSYGANLLAHVDDPRREDEAVDLFLRHGIRNVEAAAFMQMTPSLVRFRLKGARRGPASIEAPHRIIAKVSRPEVAVAFMSPAPEPIVKRLVEEGKLTAAEADCARLLPVAEDVCVEADSGGHTDQGVAFALVPAILRLRDDLTARHAYLRPIRVGAAGGIGTPHAAAAAFVLGADFILTGSINQCTVEAGTSDAVKDMLQQANVQDTAYAPAGDLFELGSKVQVLKRGLLFPARANRLYELYRRYESLEEVDAATKRQIQEKYFGRTLDDVWDETRRHYASRPAVIAKAERSPKQKMALTFRWYFAHTNALALHGDPERRADYQIHCGPALGAFNQWAKGTPLEDWRQRHVDEIARRLMEGAAELLSEWFRRALNGRETSYDEPRGRRV